MLTGQQLTMKRTMAGLADHRDRIALIFGERTITYAQLSETADRLAAVLTGLGAHPGDRVGFAFRNQPEFVFAYIASARAGLVVVPISERSVVDEVLFQLRDSGAVGVVGDAACMERVDAIAGELKLRFLVRDADGDTDATGAPTLRARLVAASAKAPDVSPASEDPYCVMYTGGTTGSPKAAVQTQASWGASLRAVVDAWKLTDADRHIIVLPMSHVAWFTVAAHLSVGARVTIMSGWDAERVLDTAAREGSTTLNMIPTMLGDLLCATERRGAPPELPSLRLLTVAGSSMPQEMFHRARRTFGPIIGSIYGMTETSGPVTYLLPEHMRDEMILSGGRPGTGVELAVLGPDNQPLAGDEQGEIGLRGPQVTTGYLNRPDETAVALAGGWFHSGDIGYIDADGFVYVVDRKKDMIKSGGFNVYSNEVEEVLYRLDDIREAAVIGVPDPRWMEAVHAVIVLREGAALGEAEILAHCRGALARHKVPKAVHVTSALPRTVIGKFDKQELRRRYSQLAAHAA